MAEFIVGDRVILVKNGSDVGARMYVGDTGTIIRKSTTSYLVESDVDNISWYLNDRHLAPFDELTIENAEDALMEVICDG